MARVVKRAAAGRKVASLTDALSVGLLLEEELCRQKMEALFTGGVPAAAEHLAEVIDSGARSVPEVATAVTSSAARVVESTEPVFRALTELAVGRGLESIREELRHCEKTLGTKYAGLADAACDRVDDAEDQLLTLAAMQYRANASTVLVWFRQQLELEVGLSLHLKEEPGVLVARLVGPAPLRVEQHSGRGLWWKVLEHCTRVTREIEFATVNAARTEAMAQFNRLGAARG